jgi:hypothetical protein
MTEIGRINSQHDSCAEKSTLRYFLCADQRVWSTTRYADNMKLINFEVICNSKDIGGKIDDASVGLKGREAKAWSVKCDTSCVYLGRGHCFLGEGHLPIWSLETHGSRRSSA